MEMRKKERKRKRLTMKRPLLVFSVKPGKVLSATYSRNMGLQPIWAM
ncbi:MAG TPA: hypothetical protein VGC75_06670 [Candidatus Nitrosocosmicus sp.]|jgi:hypothetical protein